MTQDEATVDLLVGRAFPKLAGALRTRTPSAISRWEVIVREVLPKADVLSFTQLRDDVPNLLEQVAKTLEVERTRHVDKLMAVTAAHGEVRYSQSYLLNEVLMEFDLLRPILIEETMREMGRPLAVQEVVALNAGLDLCARRSIVTFVEHQSQELLAATESHSKYLSFLSHDLRGGLNGVFLMIEVLKRELSSEPRLSSTLEDLDSMRRSLLETVGTMDRFLHAERFRKGKVQVQPARVDVRGLMNELAAHVTYQAQEKGLKLEVAADRDCVVVSDRELIGMVVQNLLSNALKYTKKGMIQLAARCTGDGGVRVSVVDDGPGMEPERLSDLFAPFTRGQTYGQPGVGLGLSIARQAADLLNARLWAESLPGKGSTFFLEIPKELSKDASKI